MHTALLLLAAITPYFLWGDEETPPPSGEALVIDVSSHQGSINWQSVASSGVRGVYHKLSEGEDFRDPAWSPERRSAIQKAGIPYGFYHFLRPRERPAAREARWFVAQARAAGGWGKILPALDVEVTELGPRATGNYVADFIRAMRARGVPRMTLYASPGWWRGRVALTPKLQRALRWVRPWIAHWGVRQPDNLQGMRGWVLHQYSATGRVSGINGNVDMNRAPRLSGLFR